jgi:hypothetical protein
MTVESNQIESRSTGDEFISSPLQINEPKPGTNKPDRWQERLLPLMGGMLTVLTAFFFLVTFGQISYLHWSIFRSPPVQFDSASSQALVASTNRFDDLYRYRQFEVRAAMERYIVEKRYHQISVQLMSGLWLRYLGFITGMILALVGASFILGKLRLSEQTLEGKYSDLSLSLRTTSPGIVLAVLGAILMFATLVDRDSYNVTDANIYLLGLDPLATPRPENSSQLPPLPQYDDTGRLPESIPPIPTADEATDAAPTPAFTLPPAPDREP